MRKRGIKKRFMSLLLCLVMVITMIPVTGKVEAKAATAQDITEKISSMQSTYDQKYWNRGVSAWNSLCDPGQSLSNSKCGGKCTSNNYRGSTQCAGFAGWIGDYIFGQGSPYSKWEKYVNGNTSNLCIEPGDIVRMNGHSAMVWKIENINGIEYAKFIQAYGDSGCKIDFNYFNRNKKISSLQYIRKNCKHIYKHPGGTIWTSDISNANSSIIFTNMITPTGNLSQGQMFGLYGTISSTYKLSSVRAEILNSAGQAVQSKTVTPNSTSYSMRGAINNAMIFNNLSAGSYTFRVTVTDIKGYSKNYDSGFSVGSAPIPNINVSSIWGGASVSMSASEGTIYYTLDGSNPTTGSSRYTGSFNLTNSACIKAITERNGGISQIQTVNVEVPRLSAPTINTEMGNDAMVVSIGTDAGASVYYTLDGSTPNMSSQPYIGAFSVKDAVTVKAISVKYGCANSTVSTGSVVVKEPATPTLSVSGSSKIATGDAVKVTWNKQTVAYSYIARLYQNDTQLEEQEVRGTSCAFKLPSAGDYTITVEAKNFKGTSEASYPPVAVSAIDPSTVTFCDYDGTVLSSQQVRYGYNAEVPATNPSRRGYDFKRWDNNAIYKAVTEDVTATAEYSKKKYIVKFVDQNGNSYAGQQEVLFDEAVTLPQDPTIDKVGYAFMGWKCISNDTESALDYEHVDANMTLQAVFDWGNKDFPVVANITKANQEDASSYKVSVDLTNWPDAKTYCRMLVTLKTSQGKMLKTITKDVALDAGQTTTLDDITLVSDKVATQVEVNILGLDEETRQKTGGAYAEAKNAQTTSYANTMWSDWSTNPAPAGTTVETKKMYSYRDKAYTSSGSDSLSGWTQYGSPTANYGEWSGSYATANNPGNSDTVRVTSEKTYFNWYHYCCNYYSNKNNVDSISYGSGKHYYHTTTTDYWLNKLNMGDKGNNQAYGGKGNVGGCSAGFYAWFYAGEYKHYIYQTRSKSYTYYYYRWGDWTPFSDTYVAPTGDREVREQTYYRYLINLATPSDGEDNSGDVFTESGNLSKTGMDLNGKHANILVYKSTNNDPTENQLEYVGQTVIGEANAYAFNFVPKESPTEAESNYIVALAIEGQTSLYNIDVIYADKPQYKITFYDINGEVISEDTVEENGSAQVPEAPEVEGYTFVGWDKDTTNVQADRAITAMYKPNQYSIVYVDWQTGTIDMVQVAHGETLPAPVAEDQTGKSFLGWDKILDGITTATDNMILQAKYDIKNCKVTFVDENGAVISEQDVPYGEAAKAPAALTVEGKKFLGWSTDHEWWHATADMTVEPILAFTDTAATPSYTLEDTYLGGMLTINAAKGQKVYYKLELQGDEETAIDEEDTQDSSESTSVSDNTVSDEDTAEEWEEYTEGILLPCSGTVSFYATADNMNDSEIVEVEYTYKEVENPYTKTANICVPQVTAKAGETVSVPIMMKKNPGIMGIGLQIKYDPAVFSNITLQADKVFKDGTFTYNVLEEENTVLVYWSSTENVTETGTMFTVSMTVAKDTDETSGLFDLTYSQEDTFNDNWDDVKVKIEAEDIGIGDIVYGDANDDGLVNNKDVAFIACYLVRKNELSENGLKAADVNADGRVDNKDVAKLARYLVGKETSIGGK